MKTNYSRKFSEKIKSRNLLLIVLLAFVGHSYSQIQNYTFQQAQGTYEPLSGATEIAVPTAQTSTGSIDEQVYTLTDAIPFAFSFGGNNYTSVNVYTNGYLSFGATNTSDYYPISSSKSYESAIVACTNDLHALYNLNGLTGSISYQVLGTGSNREFVVQWSHFKPYSGTTSPTSYFDFNFQIKLKENGTIEYVYDLKVTGTPTSASIQSGLRGSSSSVFVNRTATGISTSNWVSTTAGTNNSASITTNSLALPPSGLTYRWNVPAQCATPTTQPTNLVLTNTGIIINGSFTASNPVADNYLVLRTLSGVTHNLPQNGTIYTVGNNTALNAYVAYYGSNSTFENNYNHGIRGNNKYKYTIYAVNSACLGGPLYFTNTPLEQEITNCPATVNSITANTITSESFNLNWPATENGSALPFNTIIEVATDNAFANPATGSPFTLNSTDLTVAITGLTSNTRYFFRGKNVAACESVYSSIGSVYTSCLPVANFNENFDAATALPNCWSKILVSATSNTPTINVSSTDASSQPNNVSLYGNGADTDLATTKIILVSPELNNLAAGTHRLRFKARKTSEVITPSPTSLQIVALNGNDSNAIIEVIATFNELTTSYAEYNAYFDTYSGNATHIGIRRIGGPTYSYLYVDDVSWEQIPTCPELVSLTASNITPTGATITFINPGNQASPESYEYYVSNSNTPPTGSQTILDTDNNPITLQNLQSGTNYYVWARRVCVGNDQSLWKSTSFTTFLTAPTPWNEPFTTTAVPQGWTTTAWTIGTNLKITESAGNVIYKNVDGSNQTGTFTTISVGQVRENQLLTFKFKLANYTAENGIYNPPAAGSGNFVISISTDFGTTYNIIETKANDGIAGWQDFSYDLSNFVGSYVKIKIVANRTSGDYFLALDNFKIDTENLRIDDFAKNNFKIYPNPTTGISDIRSDLQVENVAIYNQIGQLISSQKSSHIDLSNVASGIYMIQIQFENGQKATKKIIKK